MAERRMFARSLIFFGAYQELSPGAQVLYVYLNMQADDDGFVGNPRSLLCLVRSGKRCLQELIEQGLVLQFPSGAVVIVHWLVHNQIRKDRYKPTLLQAEKALLTRTENGAYRFLTDEERCQIGNHPETQERIGEDSSAKVNIGKAREGEVITGGAASLPPDNSQLTDFEKRILELYVTHCQGMAECRYLDEGIRGKIAALKQRGWTEAAITEAFRIAGESPFLKGENKERWIASLEWLCEDENLRKVCGGKYQAYRKAAPQGATGSLGQAELEAIQKMLQEP